jgi:hypothetical protein
MNKFATRATAAPTKVTATGAGHSLFETVVRIVRGKLDGSRKDVTPRNGMDASAIVFGSSDSLDILEINQVRLSLQKLNFFDQDAFRLLKVELPNGADAVIKSKDLYALIWAEESASGDYVEVKTSSNAGLVVVNLFVD